MDGKINSLMMILIKKWNKVEYQELELLLDDKLKLIDELEVILNKTINVKNLNVDISQYRNKFENTTDIKDMINLYNELISLLSSNSNIG